MLQLRSLLLVLPLFWFVPLFLLFKALILTSAVVVLASSCRAGGGREQLGSVGEGSSRLAHIAGAQKIAIPLADPTPDSTAGFAILNKHTSDGVHLLESSKNWADVGKYGRKASPCL